MITSSGSFFRQFLPRAAYNIARVRDISYCRTAIDLRIAIYEVERALHDRRSVNIIFLQKKVWERCSEYDRTFVALTIVGVLYAWDSLFLRNEDNIPLIDSYPSMKSMFTSNIDRWNSNFRSRRVGGQ